MRSGWSAMALTWVGSPAACGDDADDADSLQTKACPRLVEAGWRRLNLLTNECFCEGFGAMTKLWVFELESFSKGFLATSFSKHQDAYGF